jgi:CSLREA domain-containing protein
MKTKMTQIMMMFALSILLTITAQAATYTVNQTGDTSDGACDASCTLRDAVNNANGTPEADTILFDASVFATNQTIVWNSSFVIPASGGKLTSTGPAAGITLMRYYEVLQMGFENGGELELSNLTLSNFWNFAGARSKTTAP